MRRLSVGDFLWVARDRVATRPVPGSLALPRRREAVLEHIVERKRMDDLAGSIMDGRCSEQKVHTYTAASVWVMLLLLLLLL